MENLKLIKNKKEFTKKRLEEISKTKELEKQIDLYKEILTIDNTDPEVVIQYLKLARKINEGNESKIQDYALEEFKIYINYISLEDWNKNFSDIIEKKYSSLQKLELIFQKITNRNWNKADYLDKCKVFEFFRVNMHECIKDVMNSAPITWKNSELYVYYLFKEFLGQISKKMDLYSEEIQFDNIQNEKFLDYNYQIQKIENEILKKDSEEEKKELLNEIQKLKEKRLSIAFCEGQFFKNYLNNFSYFLLSINDTYLKDLSQKKFDKKEDQDIFEYFMMFITNYDFENIQNYMISVWKYSFKDLELSEKLDIFSDFVKQQKPIKFEQSENKLKIIISEYKADEIVIENIDDYDLVNILSQIKIMGMFNENVFIKYVKINKINNHLYIKKIMKEWISFNILIFNSLTIKSLYGDLFDEQDTTLLDAEELKIILENIIYFCFPTDFRGLTMGPIMKLYEYGPMINLGNDDVSKVISLAFLLDCNEREILGHYNIGYQIFSNPKRKYKYDSQKINEAKNVGYKKSGEVIEIRLYGRIIDYITLKEALFILNPDNYGYDLKKFKENFQKCNNGKLCIDTNLEVLLKKFNINTKNIPTNENCKFAKVEFNKNYTEENIYKVKGNHPIGFNIDGAKDANCNSLNKILAGMEQLIE